MIKSTIVAGFIFLAASLIIVPQNFIGSEFISGISSAGIDSSAGTYTNPIIYADYSDPDVIRVGDDFYLVSSSFNCTPVMPVLHSKDLVNWTIIGHVSENLPSDIYDKPQHGKGCWAPSIRYHNGEFYVYYGDPDFGIYMSRAKNPAGPWEPLELAIEAKGWIDPCPLWDDDGKAYIVHAWAKSRVGFNSMLTINRMRPDGRLIYDDSVTIFDGVGIQPTIEGPKFYKRNSYYYIFAPAGGVTNGWQTVLRSKNIFGPYEYKVVMDQGSTSINGPHQGGWIETRKGESWFVHFQDAGAYGRIIQLQPVIWKNDWPVIGIDPDGDEKGEPVITWKFPDVGARYPRTVPQTSDEFDSGKLGLQWQWSANHRKDWYSLTEESGCLRLRILETQDSNCNLWDVPNLLLQKFPARKFSATTQIKLNSSCNGEKAGLLIMGLDYSYLALIKKSDGYHIFQAICKNADKGSREIIESDTLISGNSVILSVAVDSAAMCKFSFSEEGKTFESVGTEFRAGKGFWIGAKVGIFALKNPGIVCSDNADFNWFRIED